jgi:hypothetical protein
MEGDVVMVKGNYLKGMNNAEEQKDAQAQAEAVSKAAGNQKKVRQSMRLLDDDAITKLKDAHN